MSPEIIITMVLKGSEHEETKIEKTYKYRHDNLHDNRGAANRGFRGC
jgi:hypothetical protein